MMTMDGFAPAPKSQAHARADALRTGLVGAGAFGNYHAGKLSSLPGSRFQGVYDPSLARASEIVGKHGGEAFASLEALLDQVDAIIVAAPAVYHADIAGKALDRNVHVLVEKPLAATPEAADDLVRRAYKSTAVLQVGHQERLVMQAIGLTAFGAPMRIESVREGPPSGRGLDVSVTLDLMIHDLDLVASVYGASPISIQARGYGSNPNAWDEVEAKLVFAAGEAVLKSSRIAASRRRLMRAAYTEGSVEIDFLTRTMKNSSGLPLDPDFAAKTPDPLGASVEAFLAAASGRGPCLAPGEAGAAAVRLAAAIDAAARQSELSR